MRARKACGVLLVLTTAAACNSGKHSVTGPSTPSATHTSTSPKPSPTQSSKSAQSDWSTYHRDNSRTGYDPTMPNVGTTHALIWNVPLDGSAYAEPLVVNNMVIVATENDTVYGIRNNAVAWKTHLATPVPLSALPCGNIDPLGITGTPVYNSANGLVYAVAETRNGSGGVVHRLYALSASTGHVAWSRTIDPPGSSPATQQQRAALALSGGYVWIALGGLYGDCGSYHGWLVGVNADNGAYVYAKVGATRAGIWAPSGPAIDASGYVYVAVGNGTTGSTYDYSDSVLRFRSTTVTSYFSPSNWQQENIGDADLGSQGPLLLPNGLVFADGKGGNAYLLNQSNLGGIGHPAYSRSLCPSYGGAAYYGSVIYVPCSDGLRAVQVRSGPALRSLWQLSVTGSPVVGGGHLWLASVDGTLYEINPVSGSVQASWSVGSATRFTTPTLHGNLVIVATKSALKAWRMS